MITDSKLQREDSANKISNSSPGGYLLHIGEELSSLQCIPDLHHNYAELSLHSAAIPMQTQLWFKYIYTK